MHILKKKLWPSARVQYCTWLKYCVSIGHCNWTIFFDWRMDCNLFWWPRKQQRTFSVPASPKKTKRNQGSGHRLSRSQRFKLFRKHRPSVEPRGYFLLLCIVNLGYFFSVCLVAIFARMNDANSLFNSFLSNSSMLQIYEPYDTRIPSMVRPRFHQSASV